MGEGRRPLGAGPLPHNRGGILKAMIIPAQLQDWISIFLGILVEATPFLLLGIVVSAAVHVFVSEDRLLKLVPKNPILSLVPALGLGMLMPVCECGNVAVARRFLAKGVPVSTCIAFLLAAPILNPVALLATATAFRYEPSMVWLRGGIAFLIAASVGLLIGHFGKGEQLLSNSLLASRNQAHHDHDHGHGHPDHSQPGLIDKLGQVASQAGSEFTGMMRVLLLGAGIASATQVVIPRTDITNLGTGILLSIVAMMSLAFVLSICSTVDAFFALSYSNIFPTPAILAFLIFGPMLGMKTTGLMLTAFRPRVVLAIAAVTVELVFMSALLLNLRGAVL
ncbi:MAG: permease [Chloroflexota bacterium]